MRGPLDLGPAQLAIAASLLLCNAALSLWLGLGMERRLLVAAARTVVQLTLLGWVLIPVFAWNHPGVVFALGGFMIAVAGRESVRRTERTFAGIHLAATASLGIGAGVTALVGTALAVQVRPFWTPQYFIPLLGMLLGNSLTGLSLGFDRTLAHLDQRRDRVEAVLAMGGGWWEAARPVAADGIRTAMIPILNAMSAVGLVTIPGMMTGQILGGTPPGLASRYQVLIMFLIAGAVGLGAAVGVLLTVRALFDDRHRLRAERIAVR